MTLALFSMPLVPGSLVACLSTASASARLILSAAAASRADPDEPLLNVASILVRHASHCELAVATGQFSGTSTQDNLH